MLEARRVLLAVDALRAVVVGALAIAAAVALPIMLVVVLGGNLASGGLFSVALPVLAHEHFGSSGYGLVLAALAGGALLGLSRRTFREFGATPAS